MGKYAASVTHLSHAQVARIVNGLLRDLRSKKPDLYQEACELAIQIASGFGMAPPDLGPEEEEDFPASHNENAVAALVVLATLAPGFAQHMADVLEEREALR
jgi:hypothetical protein